MTYQNDAVEPLALPVGREPGPDDSDCPRTGFLGSWGNRLAQRVNLDAMIRREDFAREVRDEATPDIIRELNIALLLPDSFIRKLLRKPEFQRETNHWTPDQVVKFLKSFSDNAVIPSIILWRSTNFIFIIDGAHRLSALCAWIADDYGDREATSGFYNGEISLDQKKIAARTRALVNNAVGSFASLTGLVGGNAGGPVASRASVVVSRPIFVQQVVGTPKVAEDSFFAINTQGTALDETETYLIRNRDTPVAIGARAIVRAGSGHPYWSMFSADNQLEVIRLAGLLHKTIFEPEVLKPLKSLDLPLGGSASPVDALAVLIDFLSVANSIDSAAINAPNSFGKDSTGEKTVSILKGGLIIANRLTGNVGESLGLHPAVYFSNDKGKHSRFLFLGMTATIREKLRNNDSNWFKKFTKARKDIETFLIENKSLIGVVLQNLPKGQRIPKMRDLFNFLVSTANGGAIAKPEAMISYLGLTSKIYEVTSPTRGTAFSDDTKSQIFYRTAIKRAIVCPICSGLLDVEKSVSYDHDTPVRDGGLGTAENGQIVHPYCNTAMKG